MGYYHSHPDHPARPSEFDREHAWPGVSYLIVSVEKGKVADARSWRLTDDREKFDEEESSPGIKRRPSDEHHHPDPDAAAPLHRRTGRGPGGRRDRGRGPHGPHPSAFPTLRRHLYTDDGTLRSFVNVFLNDEDVRHMQSPQTPLSTGDTLVIIPSIAGGAARV